MKKSSEKKGSGRITALLLLLAAVLIIVGILAGQPDSVLAKAVRICLECVGIG